MRSLSVAVRLCVASLALTIPAHAGGQQPAPVQPELKAGDPAPDFTLQASDGKTYSLSQLRGRAVVLAWFPKAFTAG